MTAALCVLTGALAGSLITAFVFTIYDEAADIFGRAAGTVIRPLMPTWFWVRHLRRISPRRTFSSDGEPLLAVSNGNTWLCVFDDRDRRLGFSPVMLLPAGAVRLLVRGVGRPLALRYRADGNDGTIVNALTVVSGVRIARRRAEDLKYLAANGRFPTVTLPSP